MIVRNLLILTHAFPRTCAFSRHHVMAARASTKRSMQELDGIEATVNKALKDAGITNTQTKDGWCLKEGLIHVCSVNNGHLLPLLERHGPPTYYHKEQHCKHSSASSPTDNLKAPSNAFESLCRIVAGQQLAGAAAQAVWRRLLETTKNNLTPETILSLASDNDGLVDRLQKPAGLSRAKANAIVDLSHHFTRGDLTEEMLHSSSEQDVREALLQVRGLGPWSCDMFLMFTLERSNVLPVGDLGVRKGLSKAFASMRGGSAKGGALCPKKDLGSIQATAEPFAPFQSLLSFFMWKAADTVDFYNASPFKSTKRAKVVVTP